MREEATSVPEPSGDWLFNAVSGTAISSDKARSIAQKYLEGPSHGDSVGEGDCSRRLRAAEMVIRRYSRRAAAIGAGSALPGTIPAAGTAAMVGAGVADAIVCMRLQANMCMCLAAVFDYDLDDEDVRYMAFMLSAIGTLQHAGEEGLKKAATKAQHQSAPQHTEGRFPAGCQTGVQETRHHLYAEST